jgi:hypothetical protein
MSVAHTRFRLAQVRSIEFVAMPWRWYADVPQVLMWMYGGIGGWTGPRAPYTMPGVRSGRWEGCDLFPLPQRLIIVPCSMIGEADRTHDRH